jgi:hypothetical protein
VLISALPALPALFKAEVTPISRFQLERRLNMLQPEHGEVLLAIEDLLRWDHLAMDRTDEEVVTGSMALLDKLAPYPTLQEIILQRMDMRALVAALRYRQHQGDQRSTPMPWNYGRFVQQINNHWHHPCFQLQSRFTWLPEFHKALQQRQALKAETLLLQAAWQELSQMTLNHQFDFVAVVLYVLRWHIVARWTSYDDQKALQRFDQLLDQGLGRYQSLFYAELQIRSSGDQGS